MRHWHHGRARPLGEKKKIRLWKATDGGEAGDPGRGPIVCIYLLSIYAQLATLGL